MDSTYKQQLTKIENIRKHIGDNAFKLNLPQITVIGDQSSGKSSLLTELSGIPFPAKSGITTKCPIVVHTKHKSSLIKPIYKITHNDKEIIIDKNDLSKKILDHFKKPTRLIGKTMFAQKHLQRFEIRRHSKIYSNIFKKIR